MQQTRVIAKLKMGRCDNPVVNAQEPRLSVWYADLWIFFYHTRMCTIFDGVVCHLMSMHHHSLDHESIKVLSGLQDVCDFDCDLFWCHAQALRHSLACRAPMWFGTLMFCFLYKKADDLWIRVIRLSGPFLCLDWKSRDPCLFRFFIFFATSRYCIGFFFSRVNGNVNSQDSRALVFFGRPVAFPVACFEFIMRNWRGPGLSLGFAKPLLWCSYWLTCVCFLFARKFYFAKLRITFFYLKELKN